jgi:primary-amine oxidase
VATVNLNTGKVVQIVDTGVVPVPKKPCDFFDPAQIGPVRQAPRPLDLVQPQGPSFEVRGHEVRWQKWRFRYANHQREGLVLYQVGYEDQDRVRPILYRASLSELFVPYADPDESWVWRDSFDQGDYGLGVLSNTLLRGKHVPDNATLLDSVLAGERGESFTIPASIAVYERDGGILWQHKSEYPVQKLQCRRARELVVFSLVNVGNYDYGLSWVFTQDGQIRVEVELTGILRAKAVTPRTCQRCAQLQGAGAGPIDPRGADRYGTLVAENLIAPGHQHFFNFRLDFDVDGTGNTVSEMNVRAAPTDPDRPHQVSHNAFAMEETILASEQEGQRDLDVRSHRRWRVFNPAVKTALGHYPGYTLEPGDTAFPFITKDDPARQQAGFLDHQVWVTRYKPGETHAAGDYPNQGRSGDGLTRYVSDNEKLVGQDVVLWYTFGITHITRPEEWPVMPVARGGFRLVPDGFFDRNPALDVPE